ncbi:MAG: hypothetical protein H7124_04230 [Phycisphaerales bacterium]|nr:hypothetical protein [Hyphomonadaceae bacterium]
MSEGPTDKDTDVVLGAPRTPISAPPEPAVLGPDMLAKIRMNAVHVTAADNWCLLVRSAIGPLYVQHFPDSKRDRDLAILLDQQNLAAISEIWLSAIGASAFDLEEPRQKLTCRRLAKRWKIMAGRTGEIADEATFAGRARRLVRAMIAHRLVAENPLRTNNIPICGTPTLDRLMQTYYEDYGVRHGLAVNGEPAKTSPADEADA